MKVRDAITALTALPMDDEIKVCIELEDDKTYIGIWRVRRANQDDLAPCSVIDLEKSVSVKCSLEAA